MRFQFVERLPIESFSIHDACSSGGSIVIHIPSHKTTPGQHESAIAEVLHTYNHAGARTGRFSVPYRYAPYLAAERMKRGFVFCPTPSEVLLGFEHQNRLDAYSVPTGRLLWHATFEGIRIPRLRERVLRDGRRAVAVDFQPESGYYHFLLGVSGGQGTPAIVQFGRRERTDVLKRVDRFVVETFIVDPESAHGTYAGEKLPQVLAIEGDKIVLYHRLPFIHIEIAQLPGR